MNMRVEIGSIRFEPQATATRVCYTGEVAIGGRIASIGHRMISGAGRMVIDQFFKCIAVKISDTPGLMSG